MPKTKSMTPKKLNNLIQMAGYKHYILLAFSDDYMVGQIENEKELSTHIVQQMALSQDVQQWVSGLRQTLQDLHFEYFKLLSDPERQKDVAFLAAYKALSKFTSEDMDREQELPIVQHDGQMRMEAKQ